MRNLKRTLSLVLAAAMLIGMMVVSASAADFKDKSEISNTEAVDVMYALGVINGKGDGSSFDPAGTLTRAEAAKIVCYMLMGPTNAEKLGTTGAVFTDVPVTYWAAPYIGYCSSLGILAGVGDGSFNPTGELTGLTFGKMLLVALGYDATIEGYVGKDWSTNIAVDMVDAGLDVSGIVLSDSISRDNAAQMAFQALTANMVYYNGGKGTNVTLPDGTTVVTGAGVVTPVSKVDTNYTGSVAATEPGYNTQQFCEKYFPLLRKTAGELNGRNGYTWNLVGQAAPISAFVTTDRVLATSKNGTTYANLTNAALPTYIGFLANSEVKLYRNGTQISGDNDGAGAGIAATGTDGAYKMTVANEVTSMVAYINAHDAVGSIIEFIDTGIDSKYDVINITEKSVVTLTGDAATKAVAGADTQVIVPGIINAYTTGNTVKTVVGYEGLVKGDVVLTYISDGVTYIEKAEKVSGVVSGTANGLPVLEGKTYTNSGLVGAANIWSNDFKNTYDFYLDNSGAVVKAVQVTSVTAATYAVPVEIKWVAGGQIDESNFAQAKLLFMDGTVKVVTVSKVDSKFIEAPAASPSDSSHVPFSNVAGTGSFAITTGTFYSYTVDANGNYELKDVAVEHDLDTTTITTGKADFDAGVSGGNNIGSANTTFIVTTTGTDGKPVYTVYTGVNAVPNINVNAAADGKVIYDASGLASYVYISAITGSSGVNNDLVYFIKNAVTGTYDYTTTPNALGNGIACYNVKAIVNGEEKEVKLSSLSILDGNDAIAADALYQVATVTAEGVITGLETMTTTDGVKIVGGTLITTGASYTTDANTVIYYISDLGVVSKLDNTSVTADTTDDVFVIDSNSDGKAEIVYILQDVTASSHVATVYYTVDGAAKTLTINSNYTTGSVDVTGAVVITGVDVTDMGSYTLDVASFTDSGTVVITVTNEDGTAGTNCTVTFS